LQTSFGGFTSEPTIYTTKMRVPWIIETKQGPVVRDADTFQFKANYPRNMAADMNRLDDPDNPIVAYFDSDTIVYQDGSNTFSSHTIIGCRFDRDYMAITTADTNTYYVGPLRTWERLPVGLDNIEYVGFNRVEGYTYEGNRVAMYKLGETWVMEPMDDPEKDPSFIEQIGCYLLAPSEQGYDVWRVKWRDLALWESNVYYEASVRRKQPV